MIWQSGIGSILKKKIMPICFRTWWRHARKYQTREPVLDRSTLVLFVTNHHIALRLRIGLSRTNIVFTFAGVSPKKVFTCQLCGKVLCSKASLKRHIADKHAERQEEYRCVICERVYCSRNSLMTHIYTYHKSRPGDIDIKFF